MQADDFDMDDGSAETPAPRVQVQRKPAGAAGVPAEVIGQGADEEPVIKPRGARQPDIDQQPLEGQKAGDQRHTGPNGAHPPLHDEPAEQHVLSCLILEPDKATLSPEVFHFPAHRLLYLSIQRLHAAASPVEAASIAADLTDRKQFDQIGGWPFLFQIDDRSKVPTALHLNHYANRITALAERRAAAAHADATIRAIETGEALPRQQQTLDRVAGPTTIQHPGRPLFTLTVPPANDPGTILGNRYLSLGDGAVLSSSSGMGKSAMAIQMATRWSLEMDCFGIRPSRALRVLYVQSEDSDGDVAEVTASIAHVMNLTPVQVAQINTNVLIVTDRTNRGDKFLAQLKLHIAAHKPDLVILNPLQAFIDGDITASQDLGAFLREGLNALNNPPTFAYLLIHHTTKPATGKDRAERLWHEVMYDMAGGAELINWARAILSLRATPTEGEFNLLLAKRGRRAGVTKPVEQGVAIRHEPVTNIPLRHAQGHLPSGQALIYWEPRTETAQEEPEKKSTGRTPKFLFGHYKNLFPTKVGVGLPLAELHRALLPNGEIVRKNLHAVCERWAEDGDVEIIDLPGKPRRYRATL